MAARRGSSSARRSLSAGSKAPRRAAFDPLSTPTTAGGGLGVAAQQREQVVALGTLRHRRRQVVGGEAGGQQLPPLAVDLRVLLERFILGWN